jgi:hypothetical protein
MENHKILERIFGNTPETRILDFLLSTNRNTEYNAIELAQNIGITVQKTVIAAEKLVNEDVLSVTSTPSIDRRHLRYTKYKLKEYALITSFLISIIDNFYYEDDKD